MKDNDIYNLEKLRNKINECSIIFFDLDGTLIDTEPLYFRFWKEACLFYGFVLKDEDALKFRSWEKESASEYLTKISNGKLDYSTVRKKRIELMNKYLLTHQIRLKSGAIDCLNYLYQKEKKIYIVTANEVNKAKNIIDSLGFLHLIEGIISAKDVKRGKPFPYVYLKACEMVNKKPNEVVVFEDSPNGLMSSNAAGCFTVMVEDLSAYQEDMDYVDAVLTSLDELIQN